MKKIRWGILGAAKIAREQVIPAMKKSESTELVAIASKDLRKAHSLGKKFNIPKIYNKYEDLIKDPNIDAVYNPLPNHLHVPWSIKAAKEGKHVLCEKPISIEGSEIKELINTELNTGKKIVEAFMVREHPQWHKAKSMIDEGLIGEINAIQGMFCYHNIDPRNIRNDPNIGGGGLLDIGVYPIVTSRFVSGVEPLRVAAIINRDPKFKTDILTSAILEFENFHMTFTCSTQSNLMQHMRIIGSIGRIELPVPFNPLEDISMINYWKDTKHPANEPECIKIKSSNQYTLQMETMNKTILANTNHPFGLTDSQKNMSVLDAIFLAGKTNLWQKVKY